MKNLYKIIIIITSIVINAGSFPATFIDYFIPTPFSKWVVFSGCLLVCPFTMFSFLPFHVEQSTPFYNLDSLTHFWL